MHFNFQLRPVQEAAPWGREEDYSLSWFGVTDGWYWLDCGGHELFRYSDPIIESWKYESRQPTDPPYADPDDHVPCFSMQVEDTNDLPTA